MQLGGRSCGPKEEAKTDSEGGCLIEGDEKYWLFLSVNLESIVLTLIVLKLVYKGRGMRR